MVVLIAVAAAVVLVVFRPGFADGQPSLSKRAIRVQGNVLVDASGSRVVLRGVNRSGGEYMCVQGRGIFDGPTDGASIAAMKRWHINSVRLPLNSNCWLGSAGIDRRYSGARYRRAVLAYVDRLNAAGLTVIVDVHWSAPNGQRADRLQPMLDADHGAAFWRSAATAFKSRRNVIFDAFNEPQEVSWDCWRDGCSLSEGWRSIGMQQIVDVIRATGAAQPIMLGGPAYAADVSQWEQHAPHDPREQLIVSVHTYNYSRCNTQDCWDDTIAPLSTRYPVVTGEVGEVNPTETPTTYLRRYLAWADAHDTSGYLGWAWDAWDPSGNSVLIRDYSGRPTELGRALRDHYASAAR